MDFGLTTFVASKSFAGLDANLYRNFLASQGSNADDLSSLADGPEQNEFVEASSDMSFLVAPQPMQDTVGLVLPAVAPPIGKLPVALQSSPQIVNTTLSNAASATSVAPPQAPSFGPVRTSKKETTTPYARASVKRVVKAEAGTYKEEDRKIKHRLIDRARRRREKGSIEELKMLVTLEARERPDKATVVASAVRTIRDLNEKLAALQLQLGITEENPESPAVCETDGSSSDVSSDPGSPSSPVPSLLPMGPNGVVAPNATGNKADTKSASQAAQSPFGAVSMNNVLHGLASAGVASVIIDIKTAEIRNVNTRFQSVSGFEKSQLIGRRYSDAPLCGIHLSGTPDAEEASADQIAHGIKVLLNGGSFKMLTRHDSGREGLAVETVNTMFLLRDEQHVPYAVLCISTPDSRRVIDGPVHAASNVDFFVALARDVNASVPSPYLL